MRNVFYITLLLLSSLGFSQNEKSIDELLQKYNTQSVPYITVQELKMDADTYQILDTRKKKEYQVSHIPNAVWVGQGFDKLSDLDSLKLDRDKPVVVYCSVGIRSEQFGEQLKSKGFKDIQNLYGSIFAWKDAGYPVLDSLNMETEKVHVFSKIWAKYLKTGEKVY